MAVQPMEGISFFERIGEKNIPGETMPWSYFVLPGGVVLE